MSENKPKGVYLLPNLLTTAGLFAGFYAIVASTQGKFEPAAIAIFVAMIMDGLDGRVARITGTQSEFGTQYDSLSDLLSFGLAPSLVVYHWTLAHFGKLGWLASFVFVACAALRLARFNIQVTKVDKRYFKGLPSPAAAAVIASCIWIAADYQLSGPEYALPMAILTFGIGVLMVSNFGYYSFKEVNWKDKVPFVAIVAVMLVFVFIAYAPPIVLYLIFFVYALSGPFFAVWRYVSRKKHSKQDPI